MVITQIEDNIKQLVSDLNSGKCPHDAFIYELLLAYGHRKQPVTRLHSGERNLATEQDEVIWRRHLYFKQTDIKISVARYINKQGSYIKQIQCAAK